MDTSQMFKPDRNQVIAVVAMLGAFAMFATGELTFGFVLFGVAAIFSIGGMFWSAHRQDKTDEDAMKAHGASSDQQEGSQ